MAEPPAKDDSVDEAFAAYLRSCDAGEISSREEFLLQFPEFADELKELMDAADMIGRVTMSGTAESSGTNPGADTVASFEINGDESSADPNATLPGTTPAKGNSGPALPFTLGDYQLVEIIGRGGMGVVYLAKQLHLDRMVAVKMIRGGLLADEADVRRFFTEAQAAAKLHHPGIVSVHQFGSRDGHHFFSMAYIEGTDLQRRINGATLEPRDAARYVRDVARAIHHAHERGVLHRDLKPANVLIDLNDQVLVTDFGLAKHLDADSSVTHSGAAVGTPHYMAPEQAGGHSDRASQHSDVYSLGAILFACLAGRPPIIADTVVQTLVQVVHSPAPPLRSIRKDAPADLETIVAKCLEKDSASRYQNAAQLADDLDNYLEGRPIGARPRSTLIKAWHWLVGVPLVAALSGRRVMETSASHRRFQAVILLMALMTPFVLAGFGLWWQQQLQAMPKRVRIAGGPDGGVYHDVATELAKRMSDRYPIDAAVYASNGSVDNVQFLDSGAVNLAPMQATSIGGSLRVVAPLYFEVIHFVVRTDAGIDSIEQLSGRRIAIGPRGSGSHSTAALIFDAMGISDQAPNQVEIEWPELYGPDPPDGALICISKGCQLVSDLLGSGEWKLLDLPGSIQIASQHPVLRTMKILPGDYEGHGIPPAGLTTVGTTAFLVVPANAPAELVTGALDALYSEPPICKGLIPRSKVNDWQGMAFHPAASEYFFHKD